MQTYPHALAFTLTYADKKTGTPLGAKVFRYKDVQDFWKRLRRQGERRFGPDFTVRYVIVGEKGTRKGRVHYHGVMFSNYAVKELGVFSNSKGIAFGYKQRLNWTTWGHGFVEFQRADRKGISYALKYILKARMTDARSEGTHREGKTEYLASSYLWCSKVPAIGSDWLRGKVLDGIRKGRSLPSLRVDVPGGGQWYVSGELQKEICLMLRDANIKREKEVGTPLAGFSTLVDSVSEEIVKTNTGEVVRRKSWEFLINGEVIEPDETEQEAEARALSIEEEGRAFDAEIRLRAKVAGSAQRAKRCFGIHACASCRRFRTDEEKKEDEQVAKLWFEAYERAVFANAAGRRRESFKSWITRQGLLAYGCIESQISDRDFLKESAEYAEAKIQLEQLQREAGS